VSKDFIVDSWLAAQDGLAKRLRQVREAAGMQGKDLAAASGLQPARISRLEGGKAVPRPEEVDAWGRACGLTDEGIGTLQAMLEEYHSQRIDNETRNRYGIAAVQIEINKLFQDTRHFRTFAVTQLPGYLQTQDYARQVISEMVGLNKAPDDPELAVQARLQRGRFLNDSTKQFEIILVESCLRLMLCSADAMRSQIGSLYSLFDRDNIRFGILPFGKRLRTTPQNAFGVYDDDLVLVETSAVEEKYRAGIPRKYIDVMNLYWEDAVEGDEARAVLAAAMNDLPLR
jgi:transcriptional regulator with XRE-family HTH domain